MIVDTVSSTPFALLRRAKHFQYRDDDQALQQFSEYEDPVQALTDECKRVLKNISSANDSSTSKTSTSLRDASWSRFEDVGFGGMGDDSDEDEVDGSALGRRRQQQPRGLRTTAQSKVDLGRPTTPSWADFLSSGFVEDSAKGTPSSFLPPDKLLPPINTRSQSSQSQQKRMTDDDSLLEPGELASITTFGLDDAFWWVWISSLAGEEPVARKAVFGRCALVETNIRGGRWLLMEEMIKAAAPELEDGAYIAEKKGRFGFSKRTKIGRSKSTMGRKTLTQRKTDQGPRAHQPSPLSKTNIAPDQHARIQAAAAALQQKNYLQETITASPRRGRFEDTVSQKTNSVFTLQPVILTEAAPAMKWASSYDKDAIRAKYLGDNFAGKGSGVNLSPPSINQSQQDLSTNGSITPMATAQTTITPTVISNSQPHPAPRGQSYGFPIPENATTPEAVATDKKHDRSPPDLPPEDEPVASAPEPQPQEQVYIAPGGKPSVLQQEFGGNSAVSNRIYQRPDAAVTRSHNQIDEYHSPAHSPAPLPAIPAVDMIAVNTIAAEASQVPLPAITPMEHPRQTSIDRKPLPPPKAPEENLPTSDPRQFSPGPEYSNPPAKNDAVLTPDTSPESKKISGNRLKKKSGPGGFKGMFGRKKTELPMRSGPPQTSTTAVAAARAALEARQNPSQQPAPVASKEIKAGRRFSGMAKTRDAVPAAPARVLPPSMPLMKEEPRAPVSEPTPLPSPHYANQEFQDSQASLSRVDTNEQSHAEHEFQSFDQGPLEDVPAFVPEDSPRMSSSSHTFAKHTAKEHEDEPRDNASEHSNELTQQISPVQDRWAQIRKNAAARAAMQNERQSEEQSRKTDRTDDGETSGEESELSLSTFYFDS